MKVTGCGGGSRLSPRNRDEVFPGKGGGGGRGCWEQQPSTAGEDTGRMFNQEHGAGKRKAAAACPNLHTLSNQDGGHGCSGSAYPCGYRSG